MRGLGEATQQDCDMSLGKSNARELSVSLQIGRRRCVDCVRQPNFSHGNRGRHRFLLQSFRFQLSRLHALAKSSCLDRRPIRRRALEYAPYEAQWTHDIGLPAFCEIDDITDIPSAQATSMTSAPEHEEQDVDVYAETILKVQAGVRD